MANTAAMPSTMLREHTSLNGKSSNGKSANNGNGNGGAAVGNAPSSSSQAAPVIKAANIFNHQYRVRPTTVDQKRKLARNMQAPNDNTRRASTMRPSTSGQRGGGLDKSDTGSIIDKISSHNKLDAASARGSTKGGKENKKSKMKSSTRRGRDDSNESTEFGETAVGGPKSAPPLSRTVNEILGDNDDDLGGDANDDDAALPPDEHQLNADFNDNYDDFKELNFNASTDNDDDIDELNDDDEWDTDMEPEEEKPKDFSCTGIYLDSCRKQNCIPVSYFVRNINNPNLKLKHHGLGEPGMRPVSAALQTNTVVTKLDLSDNWLGPKGAEHLASMLKENCFITDLNLSENHLSTEGCELLKETLKQNTSITHLTMQGNRFDDVTAVVWAEIISNTIKLEYLDLSHNEFGEEAGKLLGPAIAENNSIRYMDLSWNNLRRKGAIAIAKGLSTNSSIKQFDLGWNGFSQDGAKALFKTIKENETLEELDLSNNRIATEGAVYIAKALATNQVLKVLKIGMNPIESAGCFAIIKQLQKNPQTKIEQLDFSEVIVDKFYREEYEAFKTMFPNIQVKTGCDEVKLKPKARVHPILKLRNYIERHRIRLIDFFNKFDKDGSMSVSREEFRSGLVELGINFSSEELDILIQDLDSDGDGEINYRDLTRLVVNSQK